MDLKQLVILALQVSILATVFGLGLRATPADLRYLFSRPGLLVRSLLAVLVIMPIAAVAMARMFDIRPVAEIALVALAIAPLPPLLPGRESRAGGHESYGLALMATLATLAIVTIPLSADILERVFDRPVGAPPAAIAKLVVMTTILPLAAGLAVRRWLPAVVDRLEPVVTLLPKVLLPLAAVVVLAGTWRLIWGVIGGGSLAAMVAFAGFGLLIGDLLGGPERDHSVVLALSTASRHPAIALSLASANTPDQRVVGAILLYLIVNALVGFAYLKLRQPARDAVAA